MSEEDSGKHVSDQYDNRLQVNAQIRLSVATSNVRRNVAFNTPSSDSIIHNTIASPHQNSQNQNSPTTNREIHLSSASSNVRIDEEQPVTSTSSRTYSLLNLHNAEDIRPISEPRLASSPAHTRILPTTKSSIYFTTSGGSVTNYFKSYFSQPNVPFSKTRKVRVVKSDVVRAKSFRKKSISPLVVLASLDRQNRSPASSPEIRSFDTPPRKQPRRRRRKFVHYQGKSWSCCRPGVAILSVAVLTLLLRVNPCIVCAILLLNPYGSGDGKKHHWVSTYGPCVLFIQAIFVSGVCILLLSVVFGKHPKLIIPFIFVQVVSISFWLFVIVYFLTCIPADSSITGIAVLTGVGVCYDVAATIITVTAYLDLYGYRKGNLSIKAYITVYAYLSIIPDSFRSWKLTF